MYVKTLHALNLRAFRVRLISRNGYLGGGGYLTMSNLDKGYWCQVLSTKVVQYEQTVEEHNAVLRSIVVSRVVSLKLLRNSAAAINFRALKEWSLGIIMNITDPQSRARYDSLYRVVSSSENWSVNEARRISSPISNGAARLRLLELKLARLKETLAYIVKLHDDNFILCDNRDLGQCLQINQSKVALSKHRGAVSDYVRSLIESQGLIKGPVTRLYQHEHLVQLIKSYVAAASAQTGAGAVVNLKFAEKCERLQRDLKLAMPVRM